MIHIKQVDLRSRRIVLPANKVGIVIAQPFLELSTVEPYRCLEQSRERQLGTITRTLDIARACRHGADKTHFTIFPEYSIPGLEGVQLIENALAQENWPHGTIVIGGLDALSKEDYTALIFRNGAQFDAECNSPEHVNDNEWVNSALTWIKAADGHIERWVQPKIAPAWPELAITHQRMFRGESIYVFNCDFSSGAPCRFFSLICFDWIANVNGRKVWQWVLESLNLQAAELGAELPLSWVFVPQYNPSPCHYTFLEAAADFFENQIAFPRVRRERACLVFANAAGRAQPGVVDKYGFSGLIFSPSASAAFQQTGSNPTFSREGNLLRKSELLGPCIDVLFRECGACIHSFSQYLPGDIVLNPGGRTLPIDRPYVYSTHEGNIDPRTPGDHVPAPVKWVNDKLDTMECLGRKYPEAQLAEGVLESHRANVADLRCLDSQRLQTGIVRATAIPASEMEDGRRRQKVKPTDHWEQLEGQALEHIVNTVDIIRLAFSPFEILGSKAHATATIRGEPVDVIAIRGRSHDECLKHSRDVVPPQRRKLLIVSRDGDNTPFLARFGSIFTSGNPSLEQERKFNDPETAKLTVGYQALLNGYRSVATVERLEEYLYASFTS
jgi:hypothetical protein